MKISIVQYLNTAPLVWGFTNGPLSGKYDLFFTVPSQCAEDLRTRAADIAIIPAIEYQRIPDLVALPGIAIASKKLVRSLLLVSKVPASQIRSIALDRSSRSTQALLKILCAYHWKIAPQFTEALPDLPAMLQNSDAALLIGDPALRLAIDVEPVAKPAESAMNPGIAPNETTAVVCKASAAGVPTADHLYLYDVVQEWRAFSGLPAVLAIWAAHPDAMSPQVLSDFQASRDFGLARIPEISRAACRELNLPPQALENYLRDNIDFSLDAQNLQGLTRYYELAAQLCLIPQANPIQWWPAA